MLHPASDATHIEANSPNPGHETTHPRELNDIFACSAILRAVSRYVADAQQLRTIRKVTHLGLCVARPRSSSQKARRGDAATILGEQIFGPRIFAQLVILPRGRFPMATAQRRYSDGIRPFGGTLTVASVRRFQTGGACRTGSSALPFGSGCFRTRIEITSLPQHSLAASWIANF